MTKQKGFGPVLLAAITSLLSGVIEPTRDQKIAAADRAVRDHFGKRKPRHDSDITDPYFGIASKGRTGATRRARMMAQAAPPRAPRKTSNPFKHDERREAYSTAIGNGVKRNVAMKMARRVAVAP